MKKFDFTNKTVIITGANSGIGKCLAQILITKFNSKIIAVARNEEKLNELRTCTSVPVRVFPLDLSDGSSMNTLQTALREEPVEVRYLICASGFGRFRGVQEDDVALLENMVDLNCRSIVSLTHAVAPYMQRGGCMILIASVAAFQPIPYIATYAASKAFVLSYGRAFNRELRKTRGARCLCVCPFWTKTAFFSRAIQKEETAVVKHYAVMYEPKQIVQNTWKDLRHKNRDVSVFGAYSKGQALLVKLLPHKWVMSIWQKQQKLN